MQIANSNKVLRDGSNQAPVSDSKPRSQVKVLVSELANDPEFALLIDKFLNHLGPKIEKMSSYLSSRQLEDLAGLAHQLKGAGGGYGYPSITEAAREVENRAKSRTEIEEIEAAVAELTNLCQQAIAGGASMNKTRSNEIAEETKR
jgi:HPt (histidine-containing phosphotransfer) domain-containing protein